MTEREKCRRDMKQERLVELMQTPGVNLLRATAMARLEQLPRLVRMNAYVTRKGMR